MDIVLTGAASPLGRAIAAELAPDHRLRLVDSAPVEGDDKFPLHQVSLLEADAVEQIVRGADAVIHTGEAPAAVAASQLKGEQFLLDWATRGTHVLFKAAVEAGVKRLVYGSTLEIFSAYPDDVYISELWKPVPAPDMAQMSRYLGELTAREFAPRLSGQRRGPAPGPPGAARGCSRPGARSDVVGCARCGPGLPLGPRPRRQRRGLVEQALGRLPYLRPNPQPQIPHRPGRGSGL